MYERKSQRGRKKRREGGRKERRGKKYPLSLPAHKDLEL